MVTSGLRGVIMRVYFSSLYFILLDLIMRALQTLKLLMEKNYLIGRGPKLQEL